MQLKKIVNYLDKELKIKSIKDDSKNGLQFKGKPEVKKIVFGVDACLELFEKAAKRNADMIMVHHGMLWGKKAIKNLEETGKKKMNFLKQNKISLYACHLPLDAHPRLGNNIKLSNLFKFKKIRPFAEYNGSNIGYYGDLIKPIRINEFLKYIERSLNKPNTLLFGPKVVKRLGIVSGGGADTIKDMKKYKIDTLLTGEHRHSTYHKAKERKVNIVSAGHYVTETFGVKAVAKELEKKFGIETEFIDVPTGL
jgi:dinuclear metal center YbgI/SA1388 family protein